MGTMNISLPDALRDFVDEQVKRGYGTSSEYVRELIREDRERLHLRELLLAGAASKAAAPADSAYFKRLRTRAPERRTGEATGRRRSLRRRLRGRAEDRDRATGIRSLP